MSEHKNLAEALVAALADLNIVEAKRTAKIESPKGSYSYNYADIGDVVKLTRPKLAEHGIVALTPIHEHGNDLACTVVLLHTSGDKMELGPFTFPHGATAQATGSAVTYHRRFALVAALGMAAGDDDDGASAAPRQTQSRQAPPPFNLARFKELCATKGLDPLDVVGYAGLDKSLGELTEADRPVLKEALEAMAATTDRGVPSENDVPVGTEANPAQSTASLPLEGAMK